MLPRFSALKRVLDCNMAGENIYKWLGNHKDVNITVTGYADVQTGNKTINWDLSQRRANKVKAYLVGKGDINTLAEKICMLIEDPERRKKMGRKFAQKTNNLTPDIILQQWDQLFRRLVIS